MQAGAVLQSRLFSNASRYSWLKVSSVDLLVDEATAFSPASRDGERTDAFDMAEVSDRRAIGNRMFDGHNGQEIAEFFKCERAHNLKDFSVAVLIKG